MRVDRASLEKALLEKGFERDEQGHHIYYKHKVENRYTGAYTYFSHGAKLRDISKDLLLCVRKQLKLQSNAQLRDLANCPLDAAGYNKILKDTGVLD